KLTDCLRRERVVHASAKGHEDAGIPDPGSTTARADAIEPAGCRDHWPDSVLARERVIATQVQLQLVRRHRGAKAVGAQEAEARPEHQGQSEVVLAPEVALEHDASLAVDRGLVVKVVVV